MNSIIETSENGNNSMNPSLPFIWTAKFKDSEDICQFDFITGKENRFKLVQNKFDKLEYFLLWNKNECFTVDLINGLIYSNRELLSRLEKIESKNNIRLIFFRRHKIEMTENLIEKSHEIIYFLGFQYNDKSGNNRKIVLQIDSEGNWIIGE